MISRVMEQENYEKVSMMKRLLKKLKLCESEGGGETQRKTPPHFACLTDLILRHLMTRLT